jgi:GTPase SAR1 family protein
LGKWLKEIRDNTENASIFLIGTKGDLTIKVPADKITLFAVENNLNYFQVSSKTGENVDESMDQCINEMIEKNKHNFGKDQVVVPIVKKKVEQESGSWCIIS